VAEWYEALQKKSTSRWDYTLRTDDPKSGPHPVGYCAGWPGDWTSGDPAKDEEIIVAAYRSREAYEAFLRREEPLKGKYHRDGHATAEEACACHRAFQLDHDLHFYEEPQTYRPCVECGTLTTARGGLQNCMSPRSVPLCPAHQSRELADKHLP
jgi:hypothetical protein